MRTKRVWGGGEDVGVSRAAIWTSVGVYAQGLSGTNCAGSGVAHVAVEVVVLTLRALVQVQMVRVMVSVLVTNTGGGLTVFVFLAVAEGLVMVVKGPIVDVSEKVEVIVEVITGVIVLLKVIVGVIVVVACSPTVR